MSKKSESVSPFTNSLAYSRYDVRLVGLKFPTPKGDAAMANAMPLRWIEHSEAREVLRTARFEQRLVRPRRRLAVEKAAEILIRLRDQLVAMAAAAMPAPQLVPVRVRPVNANASRLYRDGARELFDSYR